MTIYFQQFSVPGSIASPSEHALTTSSAAARKVSHDSPSAGSLFLRMGCVVFGIIGVVYYSFSVFLCSSDDRCHRVSIVLDVFAIVFVFTQMHLSTATTRLFLIELENISNPVS
uniref:Uncharacterized protein n=1 Tax=Ditylenchus dipsaci TaxID=166011 RepID=A0A915DFY8_9BILA